MPPYGRAATVVRVHYTMSSKWALLERFEITDADGTPYLEARGHLRAKITLHDTSGREVADIRKHMLSDAHEVYLGGQRAAHVRHAGFLGDHYDIETSYGPLRARGHFDGGDYTLDQGGKAVATMRRKLSLRSGLPSTSPTARTTCSCSRSCWPSRPSTRSAASSRAAVAAACSATCKRRDARPVSGVTLGGAQRAVADVAGGLCRAEVMGRSDAAALSPDQGNRGRPAANTGVLVSVHPGAGPPAGGAWRVAGGASGAGAAPEVALGRPDRPGGCGCPVTYTRCR